MSQKLRKPYRLPSPRDRSAKALESNAQLFGRTWTDSALCLPWADLRGVERFAVLSPSYCGDVLICSFRDGWWHEALAVFITGVTHWRLAGENEQEYLLDQAQWPKQGVMGFGLAEQRWHWLHINGSFEIIN